MADKRQPKSELCPWLDAKEADALFVRGEPGKTPDYWKAPPTLAPCPHGPEMREWLPDGKHYQAQMRCHYWDSIINPSGADCERCARGTFPLKQRYKNKILPSTDDKELQIQALEHAVEKGHLTESDALELGKAFGLTDEATALESRQ